MNCQTVLELIKTHNLRIQPCLALKEEGRKDYWSAGKVTYNINTGTNGVLNKDLYFGCTLEDAVLKAVKSYQQ